MNSPGNAYAIRVAYSLKSDDVLEALGDLFLLNGLPEHIRSDNGSEFTAATLREWLRELRVKPHISNREARGRTDSMSDSTVHCGMNASTANDFTRSKKRRLSLRHGGRNTTISARIHHSITVHRHRLQLSACRHLLAMWELQAPAC